MGAGGANYVRDGSGNWVKEFRITDYLGSVRTAIQSTAGATLNYTPYGKPSNTTDRWSYLGQEKDRETIGLSEFDYRKYQSETGSFLRPDPLWVLAPGTSSFVYGNSSPLVFSDANGLFVETAISSNNNSSSGVCPVCGADGVMGMCVCKKNGGSGDGPLTGLADNPITEEPVVTGPVVGPPAPSQPSTFNPQIIHWQMAADGVGVFPKTRGESLLPGSSGVKKGGGGRTPKPNQYQNQDPIYRVRLNYDDWGKANPQSDFLPNGVQNPYMRSGNMENTGADGTGLLDFYAWGEGAKVVLQLGKLAVKAVTTRVIKTITKEAVTTILIPLGRGSTGRTVAKNLLEQMAMKNIMEHPELGTPIINNLKDARWLGWTKMQYTVKSKNGVQSVIHFVGKMENGVLKAVDDFKFVD